MAIQDDPYKSDLMALYQEMEESPMSIEIYAGKLAEITDKQIKTGEVKEGIEVKTTGTASSQIGATTARGIIE